MQRRESAMIFTMREPLETRLEKAFERRMGKSVMPLRVKQVGPGVCRVTDDENGSWVEFDTTAWRIRRIAEHDAEASA
jgi:hypothetical protein